MLVQLTPLQARVIGVLLEKEITTPDQYPLSLNALTLGCNQKSNRDPVLSLSESDTQNLLDELKEIKLILEHTGTGSRVVKYKHRFCNTEFSDLKFNRQQLAIVCVMLLRGSQTPGELRTRTNRLAEFDNVEEVETTLSKLQNLNEQQLVIKLEREPGKREARYAHLFSGDDGFQHTALQLENGQTAKADSISPAPAEQSLDRLTALENQVADLTSQLAELKEIVDILSA